MRHPHRHHPINHHLLPFITYSSIALLTTLLSFSISLGDHQLRDISLSSLYNNGVPMTSEASSARSRLIDEMIQALNERLSDSDVQQSLSPEIIQQSRDRWVNEFQTNENLIYTAHQGSSEYLPFLIRHLPLMDINNNDLHFDHLYDNALWAFHIRGLYPWAMKWDEQTYREYVLPHAVVDEPRRGNWRYDFQWLIEREIFPSVSLDETPTPSTVRGLATEINRQIWSKYKGGEIVFAPDLTPEILAPKDVIEKKKASCTGLSLLLIYAYRSVGIPCRLAGVYSWKDGNSESLPSVIARRQLLIGTNSSETSSATTSLNNHSWVEIFDGEKWLFTGAHEAPNEEPAWNSTWFYPSKTNLQVPNDPIYAIFATVFSDHTHHFPLAWNPLYSGVYGKDVTNCYHRGYPNGVDTNC